MNLKRGLFLMGIIGAVTPVALSQPAPATTQSTIFDFGNTPNPTTKSTSPAPNRSTIPAPPTVSTPKLLPVPDGPALAAAEKLFQQIYGPDYKDRAIPARRALAKKLLDRAELDPADTTGRFVLLRESRIVAAEAGDAGVAVAAVERMAREFVVDARALKVEALQKASSHAVSPADYAVLATLGIGLVDEMMAAAESPEEYTAVGRLGMATATWAAASHDSVLVVKTREWNNDVQARCAEVARAAPALAKLKQSPDDPVSNLIAGRFYCLYRNDWPRGLPMLAKGSDAALAKLAKWELAPPTTTDAEEQVADGWWDEAKAASGPVKAGWQQRACYWYAPLLPRLTGLRKAAVEHRIAEAGLSASDLEKLHAGLVMPAHAWVFDGSGGATVHDAAGSNDASLVHEPEVVDGHRRGSRAVALNGADQYISLANKLSDAKALTVEAWIKYEGPRPGTILCDATRDIGNDLFFIVDARNFHVRTDKSGATLKGRGFDNSEKIPLQTDLGTGWHHIVWVMAEQESRAYVDGVRQGEPVAKSGGNIGYHVAHPTIGCWWDEGGRRAYFHGAIESVRLYDRACADAQVKAMYEATK